MVVRTNVYTMHANDTVMLNIDAKSKLPYICRVLMADYLDLDAQHIHKLL